MRRLIGRSSSHNPQTRSLPFAFNAASSQSSTRKPQHRSIGLSVVVDTVVDAVVNTLAVLTTLAAAAIINVVAVLSVLAATAVVIAAVAAVAAAASVAAIFHDQSDVVSRRSGAFNSDTKPRKSVES